MGLLLFLCDRNQYRRAQQSSWQSLLNSPVCSEVSPLSSVCVFPSVQRLCALLSSETKSLAFSNPAAWSKYEIQVFNASHRPLNQSFSSWHLPRALPKKGLISQLFEHLYKSDYLLAFPIAILGFGSFSSANWAAICPLAFQFPKFCCYYCLYFSLYPVSLCL